MSGRQCPRCGGTELREITPGFFECSSRVLAGVFPPEATGGAGPIPDYHPCGHRFNLGAPGATPLCACGRYSVGRCQDCRQPLCGIHGSSGNTFRCRTCIDARDAAVAQAQRQRAIDENTRLDAKHAELLAADDPRRIVELLLAGGEELHGQKCVEAWKKLAASGALRHDLDVVRVLHSRYLMQRSTQHYGRRPAWRGSEGWIDNSGAFWRPAKGRAEVVSKVPSEQWFAVRAGSTPEVEMFVVRSESRGFSGNSVAKTKHWTLVSGDHVEECREMTSQGWGLHLKTILDVVSTARLTS